MNLLSVYFTIATELRYLDLEQFFLRNDSKEK